MARKITPQAIEMMELFAARCTTEGLKFRKNPERASILLNYGADNFDSLDFGFYYDDSGKSVALKVFSIMKFKKEQLPIAYEFCNAMNAKWRWVRFYVDSDDELTADLDAYISKESVGDECLNLLQRAVSIVDDVMGELKS